MAANVINTSAFHGCSNFSGLRAAMTYAVKNSALTPISARPQKCKYIFVAPIYREFENGNLKRLLNFFEKNSSSPNIALLLSVNNIPGLEKTSPIYIENQNTLAWLEKHHAEYSYPIHFYDYSTHGIKRNMGLIRQTLIDQYLKDHSANPQNEILIHLDADTHYSANFLQELAELYEKHPSLETVFFTRDYFYQDSKLKESHSVYRYKKLFFDFRNSVHQYHEGLATIQISSRLSAHQRIGGFEPKVSSEDKALTYKLLDHTNWMHSPKITAITEDRVRADGFSANKRLEKLEASRLNLAFRLWKKLNIFRKPDPNLLHFSLFHELSFNYWRRVKSKEISYSEAVEQYQKHLEWLCSKSIPITERKYFSLSPEEVLRLNDLEILDFEGVPSKINPVAAAFPDFIFHPSYKPGFELLQMIEKHFSDEEQKRWNSQKAAQTDIGIMKKILEHYLLGKHYGLANKGLEEFTANLRGLN